ncbi:MAG: HEAT repeat domain-containing protein [Planctomycetes bacterium]|nr:HEAT repeat domain-containing protein [Planctomycetota bacterium]
MSKDRNRLQRWFRLLGGPNWEGPEGRDRALAEMTNAGVDDVMPLLVAKLSDRDLETRCAAIETMSLLDLERATPLLVPLLRDPDETVRLTVCEYLASPRAQAAVEPLIAVLRSDPDVQVRGYAACALGVIASPAAIPALLDALANDHELDCLGHSASSTSAHALDDILGTEFTRIRISDATRKMRPGPPDLESLAREAELVYRTWSRSGEPTDDTAAAH